MISGNPNKKRKFAKVSKPKPTPMKTIYAKGEKKFFDQAVATYQVNTTGSLTCLNCMIRGDDYTERIGRKIQVSSLYIRGYIRHENAVPGVINAQLWRLIVFSDSQPNGTAPGVTDVLMTANPSAQLNPNNRDRFKILKDKQWTSDGANNQTIGNHAFPIKLFKQLNLQTIFNGTNAGTIADINTGALFMLWIGSEAAGALTDGNAIVSVRIRYVDA